MEVLRPVHVYNFQLNIHSFTHSFIHSFIIIYKEIRKLEVPLIHTEDGVVSYMNAENEDKWTCLMHACQQYGEGKLRGGAVTHPMSLSLSRTMT